MCDKYNGWTNRETWALNLWLSNDQGLYEMTRERVIDARRDLASRDEDDANNAYMMGGIVRGVWGELTDPEEGLIPPADIVRMVQDVGSEYRVDWGEIGLAWLENLDDDPETDSSGDQS